MLRRTRINPVSKKRRAETTARAEVRKAVWERDGGMCQLIALGEPCFGPLAPHHLLKASAGGPYPSRYARSG